MRADAELRQLLGSDISDVESIHGTQPWRRPRKDNGKYRPSPLLFVRKLWNFLIIQLVFRAVRDWSITVT